MATNYLVNVRDLINRPGEQRERELTIHAPEKLGEGLAWVPEGREVHVELRLESVHEGILATGTVDTVAEAQSARTLAEFELPVEVEFQELFAYPSEVPSDYEVQGDHVDLEQVVRDAVVLALPFQPVKPGETVFLIGPERDHSIFDGLPVTLGALEAADYCVCTGLYEDERETPDEPREER